MPESHVPPPPRRRFLQRAAQVAAALLAARALPGASFAAAATAGAPAVDDDPWELTDDVRKVVREHFGDRPIQKGRVQLDVPQNAPDGRSVPVFVETELPMEPGDYVKAFHLLVDHNPDIYLAGFELTPALGAASIDTRIKMRRTSYVRAIAETSRGELWGAATKVWVTLNGCG
ncbi:MAG: thiosulfate oxidation carrier protein SoxY [Gemmatimonadaceae bacterium]